jgi:hypothetical protein
MKTLGLNIYFIIIYINRFIIIIFYLLGKNMAYLLKKMNDPRTADIKPPEWNYKCEIIS